MGGSGPGFRFRDLLPWRVLQQIRQEVSLALFRERTVRHSYCGESLEVSIRDSLGQGWYDRDWPRLHEIDLLSGSRLRDCAMVFDLGAHQGVVGMILARKVGPRGRVVCAEPNPRNFSAIRRNIELNGFENIIAEQVAIGEKQGSLEFSSGMNGSASVVSKYGLNISVPLTTVDHMVEKHGQPDVVFMDIEGYEQLALGSASKAFHRPCDFFVEVHVGHGLERAGGSAQGVLGFFPAERFTCFVHHDDGVEPVPLSRADPGFFGKRFFLTALAR